MSDFHRLRNEYARELDRKIEDGEITDVEADELMWDWEAGYGDHMLDIARDQEMEATWR